MRRLRCLLITPIIMLSLGPIYAQELAITPHTIRVQPMDPAEKGHWIVLPGYSELGSPCFSRDGLWVAFDAYKDGYNNSRPEVWIARHDGTDLRKLTNGATPRWSPNGKRLLFIRGNENERNQGPDIYIIKSDGTGERKLKAGRWPEWSPDGKQIAFSRGGLPGGGAKVGAEIFISNADGTGDKVVAQGDCPSWSPDGKKIACCVREGDNPPEIRVVDLQTRESKTLGIGWFRANWMPDGKALVANGIIAGLVMVKLSVERPGEPPRPLFSQFEDPSSPCPSPDGQLLVFIAKRL
jgi:Tol biopolymer transport system component